MMSTLRNMQTASTRIQQADTATIDASPVTVAEFSDQLCDLLPLDGGVPLPALEFLAAAISAMDAPASPANTFLSLCMLAVHRDIRSSARGVAATSQAPEANRAHARALCKS